MTENERVKYIRNSLGLTLEKFGSKLGVTKVAISNIEKANRNITEQMRKSICREFNINEDWLRTGKGEIYKKLDSDISQLIDEIMKGENEFYIKIFKTFARLDKSELLALEKILDKYVEISTFKNQEIDKENMVFQEKSLDNSNIEELEQEYNKTLFNSASNRDFKEELTATNNDLEELSMTVEEAEAAYIKSRSKSAQKMVQSALNTFVDTGNPEENGNTNQASNQ